MKIVYEKFVLFLDFFFFADGTNFFWKLNWVDYSFSGIKKYF